MGWRTKYVGCEKQKQKAEEEKRKVEEEKWKVEREMSVMRLKIEEMEKQLRTRGE
jgi:hypothetical protein